MLCCCVALTSLLSHFAAARPLLVAFVVLAATLLTDIIFLAAYSRSQAANVFSAFTFISKTATAYLCYAYVTQVLAERFSLLWTGSGGDEGSGVPAKSLTEAEGESAAMESGGVVAGSSSPQLAAPGIGGYQGYQ